MPGAVQRTIGLESRKFGRARDSKLGRDPDAASAGGGGIVSANDHRSRGNQFKQSCGTGSEVVTQPAEVVKGVMKTWREPEATGVGLGEGRLEVAEQTARPGQGQRHGAELAQEFVKRRKRKATARGKDRRK